MYFETSERSSIFPPARVSFAPADASARAQLLAEAAGKPKLIRHEVAEPLGRPGAFGGFSFRPYFEEIVAEQPDLLG